MKSSIKFRSNLIGSLFFLFLVGCNGQKSIIPTIEDVRVINRQLSFFEKSLELNAAEGAGMALLEDLSFRTGTIAFDIKGENVAGMSFVGLAFNIENDSTYEAIYFRPFNFKSSEKIRREHGIQYVYIPTYDWKRLRTENNGEFEAEFIDSPSPDDWFSISVIIENDMVLVKDGNSGKILMQTKRLSTAKSEKVGFWVGNNSKGSFRNLTIHLDN